MEKRLFTSECVTTGHPDKVADRISDSILDACLAQDPNSRVACETLVTTDFCCISGEITTSAAVDYEAIARQVIRDIGYTRPMASAPIRWRSNAGFTPSPRTLLWEPMTRWAARETKA